MEKQLSELTLDELWKLFPIILKQYNPRYDEWYEEEKNKLSSLFKNNFRISHIGSTAVNGLIGKPVIDILLELKNYNPDKIIKLLQKSGWILMARAPDGLDFNKGYTPKGYDKKVYHLHIKRQGNWNELYFRDYLQKHPDVADEYAGLKLRLAKQFQHDRDAYTNAKSEFIIKYSNLARQEFNNKYEPET